MMCMGVEEYESGGEGGFSVEIWRDYPNNSWGKNKTAVEKENPNPRRSRQKFGKMEINSKAVQTSLRVEKPRFRRKKNSRGMRKAEKREITEKGEDNRSSHVSRGRTIFRKEMGRHERRKSKLKKEKGSSGKKLKQTRIKLDARGRV